MTTTSIPLFACHGRVRAAMRLLACLGALVPAILSAHQPGKSSLVLTLEAADTLRGEYHVADVDLESINLMLEDQMLIQGSAGTIRSFDLQRDGIAGLPFIEITESGTPVEIVPAPPERVEIEGDLHTVIPFTAIVGGVDNLRVAFQSFFRFDPQHRVMTSLNLDGLTKVGILTVDDPAWAIPAAGSGTWHSFIRFTWEGVWHIWIGIDHILFLIALLLPSVLRYRNGKWVPVPLFKEALISVLKVVTAFTIAHSITLSLAALDMVSLPSRLVESVIAVSVVLAALNNVYPVVSGRIWLVAFGFGLIHGFGFANVLADLQLPAGTLAIALLSFNIGVELGQFAIVAVFFPLIFLMRDWPLYQPIKLRLGSVVIALIATGWIADRVFELELMPF